MIEYAKMLGANEEVIAWCNTVLKAQTNKPGAALDQGEAEHILDFLCSDAAPKRLRKMSYAQAKTGAEKWTRANQKKGRGMVDDPSDLETVHDFSNGEKIVKLLTKKAYQREGFFMAHCVGSYDPENSVIYSYRDKDNQPHATFEVKLQGDEIFQIKGKGNGSIHPKYIEPILTFLRSIGKEVRPGEMKNLGYYHVSEEAEQILGQFVDLKGLGPSYVHLEGTKYLVGAVA